MAAAFNKTEYQNRLKTVRKQIAARGLDAILIGDPANMNWLTGLDAWSFYVPQVMLVGLDFEPVWMGRMMDAGAVRLTTYLGENSIRPYPEDYVQQPGVHPMQIVSTYIDEMQLTQKRVGYESDTYFFRQNHLSA